MDMFSIFVIMLLAKFKLLRFPNLSRPSILCILSWLEVLTAKAVLLDGSWRINCAILTI